MVINGLHQKATNRGSPKSSPLVHKVQSLLNELGYNPGPVDGIMGKKTRNAIMSFEADVGLPPSGQPTHELVKLLKQETGAP